MSQLKQLEIAKRRKKINQKAIALKRWPRRKMDCVEMFGSATNGFTGTSYRILARGDSKSSGRMGRRRKQIRQQFDNLPADEIC
jgi:hypothetical protein